MPKRSYLLARSESGIALVIALAFLALIVIVVLAFFTSVTTEHSSARSYADGAGSRLLADSAVNLVLGQIAAATGHPGSARTAQFTWASQPGLIRTYDDDGANGPSYKLYSSSQMVIGSGENILRALAGDIPAGWNDSPAHYADLNAPVADSSGKLKYPIIDGNFKTLSIDGVSVRTYDDNGDGVPDVEGFSIPASSVPTFDASQPESAGNNPAPMPVSWLYVLRDGSLIAPDSGGSGKTATFANAAKRPTTANPIVGRVAFWTDDETSKLNVNTASEGSHFAYPHTSTATDMQSPSKSGFGYAVSPPVAGEYNRYPGHPATTCLSVALGTWLNPSNLAVPTAYTSTSVDNAYVRGPLTQFLSLVPRTSLGPLTSPGGSKAGTASTETASALSVNSDRLFASVDELAFDPDRGEFSELVAEASDGSRPLDRLKFFLTSHSRAPEVTPFNTPKISLWPQWSTAGLRAGTSPVRNLKSTSALLAFCSSFGSGASSPSGKFEYFFQRLDGNSFKSSIKDWQQILRNRQIANYLYNLGNRPVPGFGGTFVEKYTKNGVSSYPALVVQSLDYIRSSINRSAYTTADFTETDSTTTNAPSAAYYIAPLVVSSGLPGASSASPLKGFGHFPVCTQIALSVGLMNDKTPVPFLGFQFFIPTMAHPGTFEGQAIMIQNSSALGITPLQNQVALPSTLYPPPVNYWGFRNFDGVLTDFLMSYLNNRNTPMRVANWVLNGYTFDNTKPTVMLGQDGATVNFLFQDNDTPRNTFQEFRLTFPQVEVPTPQQPSVKRDGDAYAHDLNNHFLDTPPSRGVNHILMRSYATREGTSTRSVESGPDTILKGDWRLLASLRNITNDAFSKAANYDNSAIEQAHSLRVFAGGSAETGGWDWTKSPIAINGSTAFPSVTSIAGSLSRILANTEYKDFTAPCAPFGMTAALNNLGYPGDWDTGPGLMPDGPYVNPTEQNSNVGTEQYFNQNPSSRSIKDTFSPNRMVASAVRLGSLPTGTNPSAPQPWQTLLFCPNPAARSVTSENAGITKAERTQLAREHPGFGTPPDHVLLEFFTMPTVQPYAISEPLSTAGKVNLNYQLAPFTNIERSTALRGVLKNVLLSGISGRDIATPGNLNYKYNAGRAIYPNETRFEIDRDATVAGLQKLFFDTGNIFRYPSEVCSLFLVPKRLAGASYAGDPPPSGYKDLSTWWSGQTTGKGNMAMTGDNLREEPYDRIYPRLTTKSNTYKVHFWVQSLQKRTAGGQSQNDPAVWREGEDIVTAQYRGSSLVERYIDPNDPQLDASWDNDTLTLNLKGKADLNRFYKFRTISSQKFAP